MASRQLDIDAAVAIGWRYEQVYLPALKVMRSPELRRVCSVDGDYPMFPPVPAYANDGAYIGEMASAMQARDKEYMIWRQTGDAPNAIRGDHRGFLVTGESIQHVMAQLVIVALS
jgi:hypothetical protein